MLKIEEVIRGYAKNKNISICTFSLCVGINTQNIYNWFRGRCNISRKYAEKIEQRTRGEIKYEDLTDEPRKPKPLKGIQLNLID